MTSLVFQSVPSTLLPHITAVVPLAQSWKEQPAAPALKNKSSALYLAMQKPDHDWLRNWRFTFVSCARFCVFLLLVYLSLSPPIYINKMSGLWMTISGFNSPHKSQQVYPGLMEEKATSSPSHYQRPQIYQDVNSKPIIILIFTLYHVTVCYCVCVHFLLQRLTVIVDKRWQPNNPLLI